MIPTYPRPVPWHHRPGAIGAQVLGWLLVALQLPMVLVWCWNMTYFGAHPLLVLAAGLTVMVLTGRWLVRWRLYPLRAVLGPVVVAVLHPVAYGIAWWISVTPPPGA